MMECMVLGRSTPLQVSEAPKQHGFHGFKKYSLALLHCTVILAHGIHYESCEEGNCLYPSDKKVDKITKKQWKLYYEHTLTLKWKWYFLYILGSLKVVKYVGVILEHVIEFASILNDRQVWGSDTIVDWCAEINYAIYYPTIHPADYQMCYQCN